MKKLISILLVATVIIGLVILGCSKRNTTPVTPDDTATNTPTTVAGTATYTPTNSSTFTASNTPTITNTPGGPTPTFTNTQSVPAGMIDNCEDGDNANLWGGYWYTYSDAEGNGGSSWILPPAATFAMTSGGYNSSYAVRVSGQVKAGYNYPFAGVGTQFDANAGCPNCSKKSITSYTGVRFWIKGSLDANLNLHVILPYTGACSSGSCVSLSGYNDYRYTVTSSITGNWQQVEIPFSDFSNQGQWGTPAANIDIVKAVASELQFQIKGPDGYSEAGLNFEIWIDNLELY